MVDHSRWRILGHDDVVGPLLRSVREGRASHAYLITGPPRVGKGLLARTLAAAFCCTAAGAPCGVCSTCRRIADGKHPDVESLSPGGLCDESDHDHGRDSSRDVRICQVRRAERLLHLTPFESPARVVIIDPADALNAQSADAFLKTLEEPPARAVIVLAAVEPEALPETIRSRCRQVMLRTLPVAELARLLREERIVDPERAELLSRLSGGHIGWALGALDDSGFLEAREQGLDRIAEVGTGGRVERFAYAEELAGRFAKNREDVYNTLSLWAGWWRDLLLAASGVERGIVNIDRRAALGVAAARYEPAALAWFVRAIRECRQDLERNVNPRLALEHLMLRAPAVRKEG